MKRLDLEVAIEAATSIVRQDSVYIIGSQSILGSYSEDQLPDEATLSNEVESRPSKTMPPKALRRCLTARSARCPSSTWTTVSTSRAWAGELRTCQWGGGADSSP